MSNLNDIKYEMCDREILEMRRTMVQLRHCSNDKSDDCDTVLHTGRGKRENMSSLDLC